MSEKPKYNSVVTQLSLEKAEALKQAASEVGARVVVLANAGETFIDKQPEGSQHLSRNIKVSDGYVAVRTDGFFPNGDTSPMWDRQAEIYQQMVEQQTPKQVS